MNMIGWHKISTRIIGDKCARGARVWINIMTISKSYLHTLTRKFSNSIHPNIIFVSSNCFQSIMQVLWQIVNYWESEIECKTNISADVSNNFSSRLIIETNSKSFMEIILILSVVSYQFALSNRSRLESKRNAG